MAHTRRKFLALLSLVSLGAVTKANAAGKNPSLLTMFSFG